MKLFELSFTAQTVALASGATAKQVSDWTAHGLVTGHRERLGKGKRREYTWNNLIEVAVAMALMNIGLRAPADAFAASRTFAHFGEGRDGWTESEGPVTPERFPGFPYHHEFGETYLFLAGQEACVEIVNPDALDLGGVLYRLGKPAGLIAFNVSELFMNVANRMALDGREVLDEIYGDNGGGK